VAIFFPSVGQANFCDFPKVLSYGWFHVDSPYYWLFLICLAIVVAYFECEIILNRKLFIPEIKFFFTINYNKWSGKN